RRRIRDRRERFGERFWQRTVQVEVERAKLWIEPDRFPVGLIVAITASVELDAHAARVAHVQIILIAHPVTTGAVFDRDPLVEEDVGGADELLARIYEVGEVVDAAAVTGEVPDDAEIVRPLTGGGHGEDDDLGMVRDRGVFHEPVAERLAIPLSLDPGVGRRDRQVVDATGPNTPWRIALRPIRKG